MCDDSTCFPNRSPDKGSAKIGNPREFDKRERESGEIELGLEGPAMIKPFLDSESRLEILSRSSSEMIDFPDVILV